MEELKKQIDILINKAEEKRALQMLHGFTYDLRESDGEIQAFKLIKLLIETNCQISVK